MSATISLGFLLALGFAQPAAAQSGAAQSVNGPLTFGNNFFVTGDYVVAGAYGLNVNNGSGMATGTINIPDTNNKGLTGTNQVPAGAQIVKALLYWQTVENTGVPSGQNGFFRPVFTGGPQTGYAMSGVNAGNPVSWAPSGCSTSGTGKQLSTYRAEVTNLLPQDASGNVIVDGMVNGTQYGTYEVRLPSNGIFNHQPFTLGATLVIIFRVLSPDYPLNSVVIYDGTFAPSKAGQTVTQSVQGFGDAEILAAGSFSRLSYIIGNVKQANAETVYLNSHALPFLYGGQTAFPSYYGYWDTETWTFDDPNNPMLAHFPNPLTEDASSASTQIVPGSANNGCTALAAVVVSTTVKNSSRDGLLDSWKTNKGYCDASVNAGVCRVGDTTDPAWVSLADPLDPPAVGQKDVFVQLDYMCSSVTRGDSCDTSGANYSFDPRLTTDPNPPGKSAVGSVVDAYKAKGIHLHINPTGSIHAIPEPTCVDNSNDPFCASIATNGLAPFPNQPGVVAWKGPFLVVKNQLVDPDETTYPSILADCTGASPEATCIPRFQPAKKDSWHYSLWAHTLAIPNWTLLGASLLSAVQTGNTVLFTTPKANGANGLIVDSSKPNGRVTIAYSITNSNLNGTYLVSSIGVDVNGNPTFTINVPNSAALNFTYTATTDPDFAIFSGNALTAGTVSGFSDIGGADSLITLGSWALGSEAWQVKAGTFMHELGHSNGLTHGGFYFDGLTANNKNYTPTIEGNCKSNFQSVMTYEGQLIGLNTGSVDGHNKPIRTVDYSRQYLNPLKPIDEGVLQSAPFFTAPAPFYPYTFWYEPWPGVAGQANAHCDGTPKSPAEHMIQHEGKVSDLFWAANQDTNFDGFIDTIGSPASAPFGLRGHNDWADTVNPMNGLVFAPGINLQQVSAAGSQSSSGGKGFGGGGGGKGFGGGGGGKGFGGGGGAGELLFETANAQTYPPQNLTVSENNSARTITLNWAEPAFGAIVRYNIYRSDDGGVSFQQIGHVTGNPPATTFTDTVACNTGGYQYFVTAVINNPGPQESPASNTVTAGSDGILTGCYKLSGFSSPASAVHGSLVPITWTLLDDFNTANAGVTNKAANTLVAIGPVPGTCAMDQTTILLNGNQQSGASTFTSSNSGLFTFNWDTDTFCAGSYTFKLTLDSTQTQTTTSALVLQIDVTDTDNPQITTVALPNAVAGIPYMTPVVEDGGTVGAKAFAWTIVAGSVMPGGGSTLPGISFQPNVPGPGNSNGTLSGTPCTPGSYTFTAKVTDSVGNSGTQTLTLTVLPAPVAQINQPTLPESAAPTSPQFALTVNGAGFDSLSNVLWNGSALSTTYNCTTRQLTATVPAGNVATAATASISVANPGTPTSNVDFFQITNSTNGTVFLSPAGPATAVGGSPKGAISADFNGDGKQDLAVANYGSNNVSIVLGNGDGTFNAAVNYPAGSGPTSLIAGDFNHDGKLDLAVANSGDNTVSILLGNGDGTFQSAAQSPYTVGNGPSSVVTGDFNGDGKLDLAVANQTDHTVSILLGNGDGTFQTHVDYPAGGTDVAGVALGDFNGDGTLDLAVTNPGTDQVSILLGKGHGTFQAPVSSSTGAVGSQPVAVSAADFNNDGKLDLAVTNLNTKTVAILLGNGSGAFTLKGSYPTTIGMLNGPSAINTGDFDGDGKVDLAVTDQGDNSVSILVGNGDGTFQSPNETNTGSMSNTAVAGVAAGDFNGDGRLDVAVANTTDGTVSIMLQAPHVQLTPSPVPSFGNVAVSSPSASQQVTLTNTGSAALTISVSGIAFTGANPGDFSQTNNCPISPSTLAALASCTINVTFTPTQAGARSASLSITDNATGSPQTVSVSGTGILAPPTRLTATATANSGSVSLNWMASTSATVTGYNVYRSTTSGSGYTRIATAVAATSYMDAVASGTYYYVVTAVDASSNESANSNEANATD